MPEIGFGQNIRLTGKRINLQSQRDALVATVQGQKTISFLSMSSGKIVVLKLKLHICGG